MLQSNHFSISSLTLFNTTQDRPFRRATWMLGKKATIPKICYTYSTIKKLDTVTPYLKKIKEKQYKSYATLLEFCWHQHFLLEIRNFSYIKKFGYRLHFITLFLFFEYLIVVLINIVAFCMMYENRLL